MTENNIPKHWQIKKLGEVCEIIMGQSPPSTTYNYEEIGLPFFQGKAEFTELHPVVNKWCNAPNKIALPNDVLLSVRAPVGTTNIANQKCCIGRGLAAIRYKNYKYIFYFLKSIEQQLDKKGTGTTFRAISGETIRTTEIPIPPLQEQQLIVSKIEELLSDLENGKQQLLLAQQQLKIYRQSLLKWAFEGKLTNKNVIDGELPEGWKWVKIESFLNDKKKGMATGPFGTMLKKSEHQQNGVPVLGIENIGEGIFQMPNKIFVTDEKAKELKNFRVNENDIIISRSGTVGEICLLPKRMENSIISTNLIRVRLNQEIIYPKYFVYLFQGGKVRQQVFELCKGSSRAFLNQTILNSLDFPFCSLKEQQLIVDELESKLTVCDKIEETISQSLLQAESLKQSILKKAFEGKLV
jgi:type I restriction enzyme, S subunit